MPGSVFLEGDAVTLHPVEPEDAPYLAALLNDPEVRQGIARSYPMSEADERAWIESLDETNPDGVNLVICADGDPVGTIGVNEVVQRWGKAELGYMIEPEAWNQGYATDATGTVVDYLIDELRFEKLNSRVFATNPASAQVLEKVGFEHEGTSRSHAFVDGERVDLELYGLTAADRRARRTD
jgi:ribosomal-protein-alanine N-acetyltransferase